MHHKFLAGVLALGLAATACSGDDDDVDAAPAATSEATTTERSPDTTTASSTATTMATSATTRATAATTSVPAGITGLDASFGREGVLATPLSATEHDRFISVAAGPNGKIYASGFTSAGEDHMFAVARFEADGKIDASFGTGGIAAVNVAVGGGGAEVGRGLVVQDDGKVVVAGPFETSPGADGPPDLDVAVIRLTADGTPDTTFGTGGVARIDLGPGKAVNADTFITDNAWGVTARAGGYAVFGVTPDPAEGRADVDYAIAGLTTSGSLDAAFGTDGVVTVDLGSSADSPRHMGTQADGKLVATGYSRNSAGVVSPVLIRLSAVGVLDTTFGVGGVANNVVLPGVTESYQWAAQGDSYILAGYGRGASTDEKVDLVTYRFDPDGRLDPTFGTNGVTRIDLVGQDDRARNVTILPSGHILVVGSGKLDAEDVDAMVVMLDANGAPVKTFGDGGHVLVDLGGIGDGFFGVDVTADGSTALVAGYKGADPDGNDNDDAVLAHVAL